jgi:cobalt-precorrin 5A hydrolase/precorrin-3B C17-methyltransferase
VVLMKTDVYPVVLTGLSGARVVVVGGGAVGERKVRGLLAAGADVTVVSPEATDRVRQWAEEGRIRWDARPYRSGDLDGAALAFAAADRREVNEQVAGDARTRGILCNVADAPQEGDFHVPAVYCAPDVMVTVSTYGENPGRARRLRDRIAGWLENEGLA